MAIDREDSVFVGRVRDQQGFQCDLLENPRTGQRYLAYEPEVHWQRMEYLKLQASRPKRDGTPRNCWPAKPPKG